MAKKEALVARVAIGIRSHFVSRLPEWLLASELGAEGWKLLAPDDTLGSTRAYELLRKLAPENVWGSVALAIAGFWLIALTLNGTFVSFRRISPWVRSSSAFLTALYWTIFATGMKIGNPAGTGFINHAGFAALAAAYAVLTAREVGFVDREAKRCSQIRRPHGGRSAAPQ